MTRVQFPAAELVTGQEAFALLLQYICIDPPRTRTWNLRLRRPTPYPLGQRATRNLRVYYLVYQCAPEITRNHTHTSIVAPLLWQEPPKGSVSTPRWQRTHTWHFTPTSTHNVPVLELQWVSMCGGTHTHRKGLGLWHWMVSWLLYGLYARPTKSVVV